MGTELWGGWGSSLVHPLARGGNARTGPSPRRPPVVGLPSSCATDQQSLSTREAVAEHGPFAVAPTINHPGAVSQNPASGSGPVKRDPTVHVGARHHLVPRFYLERFADNDRIAVVNRHTRARRVAMIRDTAAERDFYTFVNNDGEMDGRLEQLLGLVEHDAARVIRNVTSVFNVRPTQDDREVMCLFLAFQLARGRASRRKIELLTDMMERLRGSVAPDQLDNFEFASDPNEHIRLIGELAEAMMPHLRPRPWFLFDFTSPALVTSDEPVVLHTPGPHEDGEALGLGTAHEIWLPLDPRHLLVLGKRGDPGPFHRLAGEVALAEQSNLLVAHSAYEEIYAHPTFSVRVPDPGPAEPLFRVTEDASPLLRRYNKPPTNRRTQRRKRKH
ncbi:DUF4238 domain-containing protein [Modestobacter sp. NPDC049651]|uniref:DUF4238 domain-containing protein n=1 Tax=unclassified Modestobacter TaxID=2643866 RepID=UPI0033E0C2CF